MDVPLPPGAKLLDATEAIRRIQERDHTTLPGQQMSFQQEQALCELLRTGVIAAGLATDGRLLFTQTHDIDGNPYNLVET